MSGNPDVIVKVAPRSRSLTLRVMPDGTVIVRAPRFTPRFTIDRFIAKHEHWINQKQVEAKLRQTALVAKRDKLFFRGVEYDFRLTVTNSAKPGVKLDDSAMIVTSPTEDHQEVRQILENFYRHQATKVFKARVPLLADLVNRDVRTVSIRSQRTRWGSCSSRNNISLNWRLIMAPDWVSDYVIYHELAHLTHMNHSDRFWSLVADYFPRYKDAEKWLKDHHGLLQF